MTMVETFVPIRAVQRRAPAVGTWIERPWFVWAWMALWSAVHAGTALVSWHYVMTGATLLRSSARDGGLHLYAAHPELQMGPLTFLVVSPFRAVPEALTGAVVAVLIAAAGPALLLVLPRVVDAPVSNRQRALAAVVLLPVWAELGVHYVHLDDALALVLLVAAMLAVTRRRPVVAALLLAASADAKPWAVAFVPLLLALPRDRWARALGTWAGGLAVAWLPFLLADPGTVRAGRFAIPNDASSSLRALGITASGTPMWDRPVQVLLGVALAVVAVRRGRWLAVPAVVLSVRMLLDPATYPYYGAGLVLATVLVDLGVRRTRMPWLSTVVVAGTYVLRHLGPLTPTDPQLGVLRAVVTLAVLAVALGPDPVAVLRRLVAVVQTRRLIAVVRRRPQPAEPPRISTPICSASSTRSAWSRDWEE